MPRRQIVGRRELRPDAKYGNITLSRFISRLMVHGKKSTATRVVYEAMSFLSGKTDKTELEVFLKAIDNVKPVAEVKSRRVGGSTYQVPVEVRESRREALSMRWLIAAARNRSGRSMGLKLGAELLDAFNSTGSAFKKKEDTHRMAEANKAFAHYRW